MYTIYKETVSKMKSMGDPVGLLGNTTFLKLHLDQEINKSALKNFVFISATGTLFYQVYLYFTLISV